jgi:hypothetical protein
MTRRANFSSDEYSIFYVFNKMTRKFSAMPLCDPTRTTCVGADVKLTQAADSA